MGLKMEFFRVVNLGTLRIEVSIVENAGYRVYFTAKDMDGRRLWRTALTNAGGDIRLYNSLSDAIRDAEATIEHSNDKTALARSR